MSKQYLTTKDLMNKYQVASATIYRWRQEGMPYMKIGKSVRFDEEKVDEWIRENKNKL